MPATTCPVSGNSTSAGCDPAISVSSSANVTQTLLAASNSTAIFSLSNMVPRISAKELWQKINSNTDILIIDTRVDVETLYASGHVKGAIPVPLSQFTEKGWMPSVALDKEIVLYCT
jgi:predicted sulfurtransferase